MKTLLKQIAEALVDQPEEVQVTELRGETTVILELRVLQEDVGKIIGKQGRTAQALRTILSAVAAKLRKRVVLEIID